MFLNLFLNFSLSFIYHSLLHLLFYLSTFFHHSAYNELPWTPGASLIWRLKDLKNACGIYSYLSKYSANINSLTPGGTGNGLSPNRRQIIAHNYADELLISASKARFESRYKSFLSRKCKSNVGKWPFCSGISVLILNQITAETRVMKWLWLGWLQDIWTDD